MDTSFLSLPRASTPTSGVSPDRSCQGWPSKCAVNFFDSRMSWCFCSLALKRLGQKLSIGAIHWQWVPCSITSLERTSLSRWDWVPMEWCSWPSRWRTTTCFVTSLPHMNHVPRQDSSTGARKLSGNSCRWLRHVCEPFEEATFVEVQPEYESIRLVDSKSGNVCTCV